MALEAQPFPMFQKAMRIVVAITNDYPALVTTSFAHQYVSGQWVRLYIPSTFGMVQMDRRLVLITVDPAQPTQFTIDFDTTPFDPFVVPPDRIYPSGLAVQIQYATVVPVGELASQITASTKNVLPYP